MDRFIFRTQAGSVLHLCTEFEADCSIRSKVIKGSQNKEIRSRDPDHAHLGVVVWSLGRVEAPSSMSVPNLKRIALFVQKFIRGSQISPHRRPLPGGAGRPKFYQLEIGHYLYLQTQFGEDRFTKFRVIVVTNPRRPPVTDRTDNNTLRR